MTKEEIIDKLEREYSWARAERQNDDPEKKEWYFGYMEMARMALAFVRQIQD